MGDEDATAVCAVADNNILPRRKVLYCGACGMPLEYCEYGPDFETDCNPWLLKHHKDLYQQLERGKIISKKSGGGESTDGKKNKSNKDKDDTSEKKPDRPWTNEERLVFFYEKYVPEKLDGIPALLEKYAGKEEKLFQALVKKYGPEPSDPYYSDSDDDDDDDDDDEESDAEDKEGEDDDVVVEGTATGKGAKNKRRGVSAKKTTESGSGADGTGGPTRILIQKVAKKKKRNLTIVSGMETVPGVKLKDISKVFSKKFAGSSSVKKNALGQQEIIIQGDHLYDVAEMIIDKFQVPETAVYLDIDGDIVPFK